MHELYELKEKLMDRLKEYGSKEISSGSLEIIDKLTHTIKNLCKIIETYEEEAEGGSSERRGVRRYRRGYYRDGGSSYDDDGGSSYDGDSSYEGGSSYDRRDSRGRYSRNNYYNAKDDMADKLRELMEQAPDEKSKQEIRKVMQKLEQM